MICETVTITDREIVVSYRGDDLSLMTPEMEARLAAFWKARIDRITAEVLGTSSGNVLPSADVPERERESPNRPFCGAVIPNGNIS